jgi:hypothetical protein
MGGCGEGMEGNFSGKGDFNKIPLPAPIPQNLLIEAIFVQSYHFFYFVLLPLK